MMRTRTIPRNVLRHIMVAAVLVLIPAVQSSLAAQAAKPAASSDSIGRRRIQPLPAIGSAPETGLQFGATVLAVWEPAAVHKARPSSLVASAVRTARSQTRISLEAEHWSPTNARRIAGSLQWQEFPLPWFGIGDRTTKAAQETFTPKGTEAKLTLQQRVADAWYVTGGARHLEQRIRFDTNGVLRTAPVVGTAGGAITEWSAGLMTDTRDNLFAPRDGRWVQLSYARSLRGAWSDYTYGTLRLDARTYRSIAGEHVVATQLQLTSVDGAAPFDQLALVGNSDIMRGYARGRFRDRAMIAAQTEYRSPIRHRLGGVAFAGAGTVAPSLEAVGHRLFPTYGAGLRFEIDHRQHTGVRADYGRGTDGASGLYIGFNNAF